MDTDTKNDTENASGKGVASSDLLGIFIVEGRRFIRCRLENVSDAWIAVESIETFWDDSELRGEKSVRIRTKSAEWYSVLGATPSDVALLIGPNKY